MQLEPQYPFRNQNELGNILISTDITLSDTSILTNLQGNNYYLPQYKNATQNAGGQEIFAPSLTKDGKLTFYLEASAPSNIAESASPYTPDATISLIYNANSSKIPLTLKDRGNNIWQASVTLNSSQQKAIRTILLDTVPSANIQIERQVTLAEQLTEDFIKNNWSNSKIKKTLLELFGGAIPISSADQYIRTAHAAYPNLLKQYMVINVTYTNQIEAPPLPGYIQWAVTYNNQIYNYYQDNQELNRVFYLPDSFQLGGEPSDRPHISLLQFKTPDGSIENLSATFRFFAKANIEFDRIEDAKKQLTTKIGQTPEMVSLQGADNISTKFMLNIPNANGTASNLTLQDKAQIDLEKGLRNELNLSFKSFRALWAAIFSTAPEQTIFTGWVDVLISGGKYTNRINFNGLMDNSKMQNYWDEIIDRGANIKFSQDLTIKTFAPVFDAPKDRPEEQVVALSLNFGNESANLSPNQLETKVNVQRSVEDIVFSNADPGIYSYTLKVVRLSGRKCCSKTTDAETIYIIPNDIDNCNGECTS